MFRGNPKNKQCTQKPSMKKSRDSKRQVYTQQGSKKYKQKQKQNRLHATQQHSSTQVLTSCQSKDKHSYRKVDGEREQNFNEDGQEMRSKYMEKFKCAKLIYNQIMKPVIQNNHKTSYYQPQGLVSALSINRLYNNENHQNKIMSFMHIKQQPFQPYSEQKDRFNHVHDKCLNEPKNCQQKIKIIKRADQASNFKQIKVRKQQFAADSRVNHKKYASSAGGFRFKKKYSTMYSLSQQTLDEIQNGVIISGKGYQTINKNADGDCIDDFVTPKQSFTNRITGRILGQKIQYATCHNRANNCRYYGSSKSNSNKNFGHSKNGNKSSRTNSNSFNLNQIKSKRNTLRVFRKNNITSQNGLNNGIMSKYESLHQSKNKKKDMMNSIKQITAYKSIDSRQNALNQIQIYKNSLTTHTHSNKISKSTPISIFKQNNVEKEKNNKFLNQATKKLDQNFSQSELMISSVHIQCGKRAYGKENYMWKNPHQIQNDKMGLGVKVPTTGNKVNKLSINRINKLESKKRQYGHIKRARATFSQPNLQKFFILTCI